MCFVIAVGSRHFDARFWFGCGAVARPRRVLPCQVLPHRRTRMTTVKLYVRGPRPPYAVTPIRVDRDELFEKALKKYCRMFRYYYLATYWYVNGWVLFPSHDTIQCGFIGEGSLSVSILLWRRVGLRVLLASERFYDTPSGTVG